MTDSDIPDEIKLIMEHINTAIKMVTEGPIAEARKGEDWKGVIKCPACDGKLNISVAGSYNGHVHGYCDTKGCLNWMQ